MFLECGDFGTHMNKGEHINSTYKSPQLLPGSLIHLVALPTESQSPGKFIK